MSVEMNVISTGIFFGQFAKKLVENVFLIAIRKNNNLCITNLVINKLLTVKISMVPETDA